MSNSLLGTSPDTLGYVFAVLLVAGGSIGFFRRGSKISLIAASLTAAGQVYGSQCLKSDPRDVFPAMLVNALLFILFAYKFFMSDKFMPAGLIMCLACAQLARYGMSIA